MHGFQAAVSTVESVAKAVPSLFAACLDQMGASVIPRFDMIEIGLKARPINLDTALGTRRQPQTAALGMLTASLTATCAQETEEMDIKTARMRSLSPDFAGITGKLLEVRCARQDRRRMAAVVG